MPGDEGAERLRSFVEERRSELNITHEALAKAVGTTPETIRNWLSGRSRVDPRKLTPLADALDVSAAELAVQLGWLPAALAELGFEVARRDRELRTLRHDLTQARTELLPAARIVNAALSSGVLAADARPLVEGPSGAAIQTAFVVSLRCVAGNDPVAAVDADAQLHHVLQSVGASRQASLGAAGTDTWIVPELNATRMAEPDPWPLRARTVVVVSVHLSTWATDVASLISSALGFGSTNTNYLTRVTFGPEIASDRNARQRGRLRALVARQLLTTATRFYEHTVWSTSDPEAVDVVADHFRSGVRDPLVLYLRPAPDLQEYISRRTHHALTLERQDELIEQLDDAARVAPAVEIFDVELPEGIAPGRKVDAKLRNAFFARSMRVAAEALEVMSVRWDGPTPEQFHPACVPGFRAYCLARSGSR